VVATTCLRPDSLDHSHRQQTGAVECNRVFPRLPGLLDECDHRTVRWKRDSAEADDAIVDEHGDGADAERQRLADDVG
jgi:hypothetical protein